MSEQPNAAPWPEGVIARYVTKAAEISGLSINVDIETLTLINTGDPYATRSTCGGCEGRGEWSYDRYGNYREEPTRAGASLSDARKWAQAHAETCLALPRPEVTT